MNDEAKQGKRPGPEPITTRNTPVKLRAAAAKVKAKAEEERKSYENGK